MTALEFVALALVAIAGTSVVLAREPLRQTLVLGIHGLALSAMFFALQAPDVALSEIVVGSVALPVIVLASLRKLGQQQRAHERARRESGKQR